MDNKDKILKTKENLLNFCKNNKHYCIAELSENKLGTEGISAMIYFNRMYHILYVIDSDHIALHIWPHIYVSPPYKSATSKYIAMINNLNSPANFHISDFGNLFVTTEHYMGEEPIKEDIFKKMENSCMLMLGAFEHILEKLSYGDLLHEYETRPSSIKNEYFYNVGEEIYLESPAGKDHYEFYFDEDDDNFFDCEDEFDEEEEEDDDNELINEERRELMMQRFLAHIASNKYPNPDYDPYPYPDFDADDDDDPDADDDSSRCSENEDGDGDNDGKELINEEQLLVNAASNFDSEGDDLSRLSSFLKNTFVNDHTDSIASQVYFESRRDMMDDDDL